MNVKKCRVTKSAIASFMYYHLKLQHLEYEDTVGACHQLNELGKKFSCS